MKKGLLSILAGALLVVGCQNYDDQFNNLESQISALATTVAGLSQVQSDLSSLAGTVNSLSSTVNGLGDTIDTAVADGLTDIQADIDAIEAAVADVASSEEVSDLSDAVAASQEDLDELLAASSVFTGTVTVNSTSTLNAFHAMKSSLAIVNGSVDIDVTTEMDIVKTQELVDAILTVTGSFDYAAAESSIAEVTFTSLTGVQSLTLKQAGGYDVRNLVSATNITLKQDFESTVDVIHFGALTSVSRFYTDTTTNTIDFGSATELHLTSLPRYNPNSLTINIDEGGVLAMPVLDDVDADGDQTDLTLNITGPSSVEFTNIYDGAMTFTDVDSVTVSGFTGTLTISTGVETLSVTDGVTVSLTGATDLVSASVDLKLDDDPALTTATKAYQGGSIDVTGLTDLETLTVSGAANDVTVSGNANLIDLTITATMDDLTINDSDDLTTVTVTGAKIHDISITGNGDLTSLTLDHTVALDTSAATAEKAASLTVSGNAKLASLTYSADKVDNLVIANNAKLATVDFTGLATIGNTTATVNITSNNFTASKAKDDYNAATAADAGSFTTSSGLGTLQTYLDAAVAAPSTSGVKAYFDVVEVTETQSTSGGDYTENASYTVDQTDADNLAAIVNITASVSSGRSTLQAVTAAFPLKRALGAGNAYTALSSTDNTDDIKIADGTGTTKTFTTGTATGEYATVDALIAAIDGDTTLSNVTVEADRDAYHEAEYQIAYTVTATGLAATFSDETRTSTGTVYFTFGTDPEVGGTISGVTGNITGASKGSAALASAIATKLNAVQDAYVATSTVYGTIQVAALVSGTTEEDRGPHPHSFPDLVIETSGVTGTLLFAGGSSVYSTLATAASNTTAIASSLFNLAVVKNTYSGVRVTLKNNVTTVAKTMTITFSTAAQLSSAFSGNGGNVAPTTLGVQALVAGTNVAAASVNSSTLDYVADFSDIEAVVTTAGNDTDRTGWFN